MRMLTRCFATAAVVCAVAGLLASTSSARVDTGPAEVTIDFSSYGSDKAFEPDFFRSEGILFPPERCGSAGCDTWYVGFVQGDAALVQTPSVAPIEARFRKPISRVSLRVAPSLQGTATYVLRAFSASGLLVASTDVTVTEDFGDPENTGFGYFTIALPDLPRSAKTITLDNTFVRSSFPFVSEIPYGVSSITYARWERRTS